MSSQQGKAHWVVMAVLALGIALILILTSESEKPDVEIQNNFPPQVEVKEPQETPLNEEEPTHEGGVEGTDSESDKDEEIEKPIVTDPLPEKPPLNEGAKEDILNIIASYQKTGLSPIPKTAPVHHKRYTSEFDELFHTWTVKYWGHNYDWRMFKAQAIQESALKVNARSWVGAQGLMQIMPATYGDIVRREPSLLNAPYVPKWNIAAGVWYMKDMWRMFPNAATPNDRLKMAQGSYNGGAGNIRWGIRRCKKVAPKIVECTTWHNMSVAVIEHPPKRWRYHETLGYVSRISWLMGQERTPVPPKQGKKVSTYQEIKE